MDINAILTFVSDNFTPLLTAVSVLSFIINIIQYKTNRDIQYHLDSIFQTCMSTIRVHMKDNMTTNELINTVFVIRTQAVSGLRSLGIHRSYGEFDAITNQGFIARFLGSNYQLMLKVKEKWPVLFGKESPKIDGGSDLDSGS